MKPTVVFVCTHNAGRSALGAALAREHAGDRATVLSAGVAPAEKPSEGTIASLAEIGIDDSGHVPTKISEDMVRQADIVVAMKPGLDIPKVEGVTYETWDLPNPEGWEPEALRPLRNHIQERVAGLLERAGATGGDRAES